MARYDFWSGEVDDITIWFGDRLSGETISATKWNWYFGAGFTGFQSATAAGGTGMQVRISATGTAQMILTGSAVIFTTGSGRRLIDKFQLGIKDT